MSENVLLTKVADYYSGKVRRHGETAQGVDWKNLESQTLRFEQLLKVLPEAASRYSIFDFGCGYGALVDRLDARRAPFQYRGYDVAEEMVKRARKLYPRDDCTFASTYAESTPSDYLVASGIFNVRLDTSADQWTEYILTTLEIFHRLSTKGFAFNLLTSYSDPEFMRDDLFYADPCWLFDHCKRKYSQQVALLHDYGLYEFTLLVRKDVA